MTDYSEKLKTITPIGLNYIYFAIPDLAAKAFEAYKQRAPARRIFQVSLWEGANATAAVVLSVIAIEAYRNRLYYFESKKRGTKGFVSKNVPKDFGKLLAKKDKTFPRAEFENILTEIFIVRDVIVHSHMYEVDVRFDEYWTAFIHRQKRLGDYGDQKFKGEDFVNHRTRRTKTLGFNVQPAKIGFEELFKVLMVFDLLIAISRSVLEDYTPFHMHFKAGDAYLTKLPEILAYYFDEIWKIPNKRFIDEVELMAKDLEKDFAQFPSPDEKWDLFITNRCPWCSKLGFEKRHGSWSCRSCGRELGIGRRNSITVGD